MELMIPYDCPRCGVTDEAQFRFAGPHIKQVCNHCGSYVKFFNKSKIPDHQEIRLKIWSITQDLDTINKAKSNIGFVENLKGLHLKIMYWRLYLELRKGVEV